MEPPAYSLCERVPGPPASLCKIGRVLWNVTAQELFDRRVLTVVGLAPLEAYCGAFALSRDLIEAARKNGYVRTTNKGFPVANPEVTMATTQVKVMLSIAKEFGFTPGSQSRIAVVPEASAEEADPIAAARLALQTVRPS